MSTLRNNGIAVLALVSLSCESPVANRSTPGLTIRVEGGLVDTIATPPTRIVAEVHSSSGNPVPGAIVEFLHGSGTVGVYEISPLSAQLPFVSVTDTADASGNGEARLWHGARAGEAELRVVVLTPTGDSTLYSDSVTLRTTPGRPAQVLIAPADTALYQGNSAAFRASVADRGGNTLPDVASFEGTPGISVSGAMIQATAAPSRQVVRARSGTLVDSVWLSIVPRGTIVVRSMRLTDPDYQYVFATMQIDGSEYHRVLPRGGPSQFGNNDKEMSPQWGHTGDYLLFFDGYPNKQLYRTTLDGVASLLFPRVTEQDIWQQETRDGSWIYFDGATPGAYRTYIYRARSDGTEASRVSPGPEQFYQNDVYPSPSPDGRYVVYATDRENGDIFNLRLQILDADSGKISSLGVAGTGPRWSPTGEWIVFGDNAHYLNIIHPDGTGFRRISAYGYEPWASWSPDGRWIVAERFGPIIDLIEVETGLTLPLGFTGYLTTPAWKP